ncbi:YdcF family protein [Clostridium sp. AL.422]|uniref:YdcF family protein n=1 Tax=Clostridium TaxID=1485 RepID=UPI00293DB28E|nr:MULTISPECIES: YdcF family protein [unclassified Clostridium]MDV4152621.1 YdcF family protein [Clostridium sp. AL.422]
MNRKFRYINDISNFIFIKDNLEKADIIFIPGGTYPEVAEEAANLWKKGFSNLILPSGAYGINVGSFRGPSSKKDIYNKKYVTEWEFLRDVLVRNGVKEEFILKEDKATFTYENAIFSKKATDSLGMEIKKAIICCKSYHARRCLMYYETLYNDTEFIIHPVDIDNIRKDNWYKSKEGISLVLGELERYGWQFKDILSNL